MLLRLLLLLLLFLPQFLLGQYRIDVRNVADCYGNSFIEHPGDYELQFTGRPGIETDFNAYPSLSNIEVNNTFWTSFTAPHDGLFLFTGFSEEGLMDFIIFSREKSFGDKVNNPYVYSSVCDNINDGTAVIERILKVKGDAPFGLSKLPDQQFLYGLKMKAGMEIYLMFNTSSNQRIKTQLKVEFEIDFSDIQAKEMISLTDTRGKKECAELNIQLRDKSTGLPIKGKMIVKNSKKMNGLYIGSDFLFSIRNRETLQLSIDVVGYFFQDKEITVEENKDHEMILWLEPANLGKRIELQGIQFKVGSSEFIAGSEEKLGRLKDFLLLNSSVHIEIEGHVYELGENSFAGKRMSAARAKNVMKYLIDSGVDRTRLSAKGYGNEFMVFPEPKFDWQEQANRRVEIRILKNE
jgi:outer membrane protein OmpA-like peptidoglycan-associated protein